MCITSGPRSTDPRSCSREAGGSAGPAVSLHARQHPRDQLRSFGTRSATTQQAAACRTSHSLHSACAAAAAAAARLRRCCRLGVRQIEATTAATATTTTTITTAGAARSGGGASVADADTGTLYQPGQLVRAAGDRGDLAA